VIGIALQKPCVHFFSSELECVVINGIKLSAGNVLLYWELKIKKGKKKRKN